MSESDHKCPKCEYSGPTSHAVAVHFGHEHDGKLTEEYPDYNTSIRDETKQKVAQARKREAENGNHPMQREDVASKQSESLREKAKDGEHPSQQNDVRQKISATHRQKAENGLNPMQTEDGYQSFMDTVGSQIEDGEFSLQLDKNRKKAFRSRAKSQGQYVEDLGYTVDSSWEKEFGLLLMDEIGHPPEREPQFDLGDSNYYPDFIVGNVVFEVKGYCWDKSQKKAKKFIEMYPEYTYVVVGEMMPSDKHFSWADRKEAVEVL